MDVTHDYLTSLMDSLQKFRESEFLCDIALTTDDQQVLKAHSVVLAAASPVFHSALASSVDREPGPLQVNICDHSSDVLEIALQFIYSGRLLHLPPAFQQESEWTRLVSVFEQLGLNTQLLSTCEKTFDSIVYEAKTGEDCSQEEEQEEKEEDACCVSIDTATDLRQTSNAEESPQPKQRTVPLRRARRHILNMPESICSEAKRSRSKLFQKRRGGKSKEISAIKQETSDLVISSPGDDTRDSVAKPPLDSLLDEYKKGFVCSVCGGVFKSLKCLLSHERRHGTGIEGSSGETMIFICNICSRGFGSDAQLTFHKRRHTGSYSCSVCARNFTQLGNLQRHMYQHSAQKPFVCELCARSFVRKEYLEDHLAGHTDGARPFSCNECPKRYCSLGSLRLHIRQVHLQPGSRPTYPCDICKKGFSSKGSLQGHMRVHTGERPFVCYCGKTYAYRVQLVHHAYSHSDERPYRCQICEQAFRFRSSLVRHVEIHTGVRTGRLRARKVIELEDGDVKDKVQYSTF